MYLPLVNALIPGLFWIVHISWNLHLFISSMYKSKVFASLFFVSTRDEKRRGRCAQSKMERKEKAFSYEFHWEKATMVGCLFMILNAKRQEPCKSNAKENYIAYRIRHENRWSLALYDVHTIVDQRRLAWIGWYPRWSELFQQCEQLSTLALIRGKSTENHALTGLNCLLFQQCEQKPTLISLIWKIFNMKCVFFILTVSLLSNVLKVKVLVTMKDHKNVLCFGFDHSKSNPRYSDSTIYRNTVVL